jgi:hypothetical protein
MKEVVRVVQIADTELTISKDLPENCCNVIFWTIFLNSWDDFARRLNFQTFRTILLVEICKEILIHSLSCHFALEVPLFAFQLRFVDLFHSLFQLFQAQNFTGAIISVFLHAIVRVENVMLVVYKLASLITQRDFFKKFWPTDRHRRNYSLKKKIPIDDKKNHCLSFWRSIKTLSYV